MPARRKIWEIVVPNIPREWHKFFVKRDLRNKSGFNDLQNPVYKKKNYKKTSITMHKYLSTAAILK
jgi:hypothetical protein